MRFRYTFQKIVDLKTNEKTQAEWILSQAIGKMREEESSLHELHSAKDELYEQLHTASSCKATISQLLIMQQYVDHIDHQIVLKNKDLEQAQQVVTIKQNDLAGKMVQEKVWCKAKEKALQGFTSRMLKKEQEQLDEMATNRFRRLS
ncbi:flagellar export protein FliJ [Paenibacillus rigui]|uniref:Flagellar FliJ protein n=1 Tax=Paenibacillus rigui TaxID=554312 RepID=A0A229UP47_9BACL|nr:flagellar export protein FliJ [Paenibacillus rigui]OXM84669.1 flagellar export protein FliJ [Paenibacillus rigui]